MGVLVQSTIEPQSKNKSQKPAKGDSRSHDVGSKIYAVFCAARYLLVSRFAPIGGRGEMVPFCSHQNSIRE